MRMIQIQDNISEQKNLKDKLESEQEKLHVEYNKVSGSRVNDTSFKNTIVWLQENHVSVGWKNESWLKNDQNSRLSAKAGLS